MRSWINYEKSVRVSDLGFQNAYLERMIFSSLSNAKESIECLRTCEQRACGSIQMLSRQISENVHH